MKTNYILIDYENVQVKSLALLTGGHFQVRVFLGPKNSRLSTEFVLAMKDLGSRGDYVVMEMDGKNALDFHIAYYLGQLTVKDPTGCFCIISKDTGFDPLVAHLKQKGFECARVVSIEAMPCFASAAKTASKPVAKPAAVKKVASSDKLKADALAEKIVANLKKRASGKPQKEKTLRSTIKTLCGSQYSEKELEAVFDRLVKTGVVKVEGTKVSYVLPE